MGETRGTPANMRSKGAPCTAGWLLYLHGITRAASVCGASLMPSHFSKGQVRLSPRTRMGLPRSCRPLRRQHMDRWNAQLCLGLPRHTGSTMEGALPSMNRRDDGCCMNEAQTRRAVGCAEWSWTADSCAGRHAARESQHRQAVDAHRGCAWQSGMLCSAGTCGSSTQLQKGPEPKMRAFAGMLLSATVGMRRLPSAAMPARQAADHQPVSVRHAATHRDARDDNYL